MSAPHLNPFGLLGGALKGQLPNPGFAAQNDADLVIARSVFGSRQSLTPAAALSLTTRKGDLLTFSTSVDRLPVGTGSADVLQPDSTTSTGLKWAGIGIPQNHQGASYGIVLSDNGTSIDHLSGDGAGHTYTLPANGTLALPIGFSVNFCNLDSNAVTIAITTDTLYWSPSGGTGSRTLAQYGMALARKVASTVWLLTGSGLT